MTMTRITRLLISALIAAVAVMGLCSTSAFAREGIDGNNVVCGGVPTKAKLLFYVKGGSDKCGHHDISKIWAKLGITSAVAQKMHSGEVCSDEGLTSSGRQHSPNEHLDKLVMISGQHVYFRPLSVWGSTCYKAWVGHTEDGHLVAVLKGCGNGEGNMVKNHPHHHKHKCGCESPPPHCSAGQLTDSNGNCVNQSNTSTQTCGTGQVMSSTGCLSIQINNNCGTVILGEAKEVVVGGNCNTEKTEIVEKPCKCEPPPHEKEKPCEGCGCKGECKPPPPSPPTIVSVTMINDIRIGDTFPNFCVAWDVPGNDTAILTMAPKYSNFGPRGGKIMMSVSKTGNECVTVYPPTEVPPGGMDKMTVTLRDTTTELSATPEVQEFKIDPEPVNPG